MALPRSNLVKSKSKPPPGLPSHCVVSPASVREPLYTTPDTDFDLIVEGDADAGAPDAAISKIELLERAAAMGPARMTWESIVLPSDPILDEKRQPRIAQRRRRLTLLVGFALAACVVVCIMAFGVRSFPTAAASSMASLTASSVGSSVGVPVPSTGIVPVEALDRAKHGKARRIAPVASFRAKRR